jgi:hypothetical protein
MFSLIIGQPYDSSIIEWPEGCHFNYDDSGHWLHYMFNNPSKDEIESIQSGSAEFGLFIQEPVIFLLHRFGEMLWQDASYSWWRVAKDHRHVPDLSPAFHALLKVVLIDSSNGIVKAMRALTFSAEFTHRLHKEIIGQIESPWDAEQHDRIINSIYQTYTSAEMADHSVIRCRGGE